MNMKEDKLCNCMFCGVSISSTNHREILSIHRGCKSPKGIIKREKTFVELPICTKCCEKLHPYTHDILGYKFPIFLGAVAVFCVLFSFFQKDFFSVYSPLAIIISILFCAGGAFGLTCFGFFMVVVLFDNAFKPSIRVEPYSDLEVVKYIKNSGFVDEDDENYNIVKTNDVGYVPFMAFRDAIKHRFGLK